jgi:hypothetical protein
MTQDEIIEMARESGMELYGLGKDRARFVYHLEAFANLVAAKLFNEKKHWVGLAAEDRLTAKYMQDAPDGIEAVIDYIEAKLKEKNGA